MKNKSITLTCIAALIAVAGGFFLYNLGMERGAKAGPSSGVAASGKAGRTGAAAPGDGRKVLYWHDPMVPGQKFDKPGKSPFMDMPLAPVYAGDAGDEGKVNISARMQQNLGVRTAAVTKGKPDVTVQAVGSIGYNERDVALIQARGNGYVERLHVRALFDTVRKGQPLAELYVPDWVAAQEEYLSVKRMGAAGTALLAAARQRMRLAGMSDDQVRRTEADEKVSARITIAAPISGVITQLDAREGMTVATGAPLFRITGTDTVWVNAEVPESMAALVGPGAVAEIRSPAFEDKVFRGKVSALLPDVNVATRTLKARVEIANPGGLLVPGMFANISLRAAERRAVLLVPSEAVIETGERSVVMVSEGQGKFHAVDVDAGADANGMTEIRKGLDEGQLVVVSGQFLIDSEASLKGAVSRMGEVRPPSPAARTEPVLHRGEGTVEQLDGKEITLSHGPIPTLKWGAMMMGFQMPAGGLPRNIVVGDKVSFTLRETADGAYQIATISRLPGSAK